MNTYTYKTSINSISLSFNALQCNKNECIFISLHLHFTIFNPRIQHFTFEYHHISNIYL